MLVTLYHNRPETKRRRRRRRHSSQSEETVPLHRSADKADESLSFDDKEFEGLGSPKSRTNIVNDIDFGDPPPGVDIKL